MSNYNKDDFEQKISHLVKDENFVGIGETGLDFIEGADDYKLQVEVFKEILEVALRYDLSVNIHARNSLNETIEILETFEKLPRCILHCFDGDKIQLKKLLDLGMYIGFNGLITYNDRNKKIIEAIKEYPQVDKFVLETDAPYLSPGIYRGRQNKNLPQYLNIVSKRIADEINLNPRLLHETLNLNAFGIYKFKK